MRHTRTGPSHFVFPDYEFSPRCATDLVFYRCMRMSPLAPPAGGAFFMRAVCNRCCVGLWTQKPDNSWRRRQLRKDDQGDWRGKAMKDGKSVTVSLDFQATSPRNSRPYRAVHTK